MIAGFSVLDSEFLMEPKQQEIVGYRVLPFAFLSKLPTLIFPKQRKVVSWRFDVTTDELFKEGNKVLLEEGSCVKVLHDWEIIFSSDMHHVM